MYGRSAMTVESWCGAHCPYRQASDAIARRQVEGPGMVDGTKDSSSRGRCRNPDRISGHSRRGLGLGIITIRNSIIISDNQWVQKSYKVDIIN